MNIDGTLDEAYERLHRTGPEFEGRLSNHGPMAVESMVRRGHARQVHRRLDRYVRRLDELPRGASPVTADGWRAALGDPHRLGDWLAFFEREVTERPRRTVLETWWPRLLPGIAAGATHGVIRTGHAVHALLDHEDGPRLAELGQALGYWAARWQQVPSAVPSGTAGPASALAAVPRVPDQKAGINHRLGQLADLTGAASRRASGAAGEGRAVRGVSEEASATGKPDWLCPAAQAVGNLHPLGVPLARRPPVSGQDDGHTAGGRVVLAGGRSCLGRADVGDGLA
ncbi:questin oxidase family protein [Actinoallomurus sp. CA-142502]|uniref:questin oxidase family protein n=1 Tax=Actinoallomurus sp. CA-142502 TaxID=3239885 RepID=UPI003D9501B2